MDEYENIIRSPRLELVPMGPDLLEALLVRDHARASQISTFQIPEDLIISAQALQMRLKQLRADPQVQPWSIRAIVLRESQMMCGRIGFHSEPAPEDLRDIAPEGVELGYEIAESFRRKGYAKEAAVTLMRWAFEVHGQRSFILSISPANKASLAMAHALGFCETGSHMDDEDGLELYFQRQIKGWPNEWKSVKGIKNEQ